MTPTAYKATNEFIRKTKDRQSLFVIAALSIALVGAVVRLFSEPGRPLLAVLADWAIIVLIAVINVFSILIVVKTSKTLIDNGGVDAFLAAERRGAASEEKRRNSIGITGYGETTRKMTPDELEAAGLPRDFHGAA